MNTAIQKYEIDDKILKDFLDVFGQSKLTDAEKTTFLQIAKASGLNPFKREIHLIKYGEEFGVVTGFEVYVKRAEATGLLGGWKVWTEGKLIPVQKEVERMGKNGKYKKLVKTWEGDFKAVIKIIRKDWKQPFQWEVVLSEYAKDNAFWEKPITMLKKVVTGQGFRLCFQETCGGLPYTMEEQQSAFVPANVIESNPIKLTTLQQLALELLGTAVFNDPKSYTKTEQEIKKDDNAERIQSIVNYLKTKQPDLSPDQVPTVEVEIIPEPEQLKPTEKELEILAAIDRGESIPSVIQGKLFDQELLKETPNDKI